MAYVRPAALSDSYRAPHPVNDANTNTNASANASTNANDVADTNTHALVDPTASITNAAALVLPMPPLAPLRDEHYATGRLSLPNSMPKLMPTPVFPRRHAKVAEALASLQQIDFVDFRGVRKMNGTLMFVVDVYLKRNASRLPTNRTSRSDSLPPELLQLQRESMDPDYRIEKTLREIQTLRYHTWVYAQQAAKGSCRFCSEFLDLTGKRFSNRKLLMLLWPSMTARKKVLDEFLNAMISLSVEGLAHAQRTQYCQGFEHIPVRVDRFVKKLYLIDRL